ncbi:MULTISPECIES: hypothetical protein [unclassified Kribbella]|uniref:hypothetical protein n=1 Tax=unclassified Kribbella TaxID=2644121 RepID=UPI003018908C
MAVMGDQSAEVWAEELRRTGRVVFPVRRRPALIRLAAVVLLFGGSQVSSLIDLPDAGKAEVILTLLGLSAVLCLVGMCVWQLITRRPVVIVDGEGIRTGRKAFIAWTELGTIGTPGGPAPLMTVPLIPNNVWAKHLAVPRDNVKDLPALATWLTALLDSHRNSTTS